MKLPNHIENPDPNIYLTDNYITLDFETTNYEKGSATNGNNSVVLSVWKDPQLNYSWKDEYGLVRLVQSVEETDFLIAHNTKFELQWLSRAGIDLTKVVVWDTQIAEYVIQGNRKARLSLDETAKRYGLGQKDSLVSTMIHSGICPSEIHKPWLLKYCIKDVELAEKLYKAQLQWILDNNPELLQVVFTRCLLTPVLADIEFNGVCLDEERVSTEYEETTSKFNELTADLEGFAEGLNWNSPQQVSEFLYDELRFAEPRDRRGNAISSLVA